MLNKLHFRISLKLNFFLNYSCKVFNLLKYFIDIISHQDQRKLSNTAKPYLFLFVQRQFCIIMNNLETSADRDHQNSVKINNASDPEQSQPKRKVRKKLFTQSLHIR